MASAGRLHRREVPPRAASPRGGRHGRALRPALRDFGAFARKHHGSPRMSLPHRGFSGSLPPRRRDAPFRSAARRRLRHRALRHCAPRELPVERGRRAGWRERGGTTDGEGDRPRPLARAANYGGCPKNNRFRAIQPHSARRVAGPTTVTAGTPFGYGKACPEVDVTQVLKKTCGSSRPSRTHADTLLCCDRLTLAKPRLRKTECVEQPARTFRVMDWLDWC